MRELRPQHVDVETFVTQVERMRTGGYQMAYLETDDIVRAVAGFRVSEKLSAGKFLYVDDLVTRATDRSLGYGGLLFDWLVEYAAAHDCAQFQLDSGVQRFAAHRFYLQKGMDITCHHFGMAIDGP